MTKTLLATVALVGISSVSHAESMPKATKLYYTSGACSLASRIVANELGIKLEYEAVDLSTHKTASGGDFYLISKKGAVPTLELSNGQVLTENAAIMQFLSDANGYKLLDKAGDFNRYRVLEGVNYISTELHKTFGLLFQMKNEQAKVEAMSMAKDKLTKLDVMLEGKKYFVGSKFTIADAYLTTVLTWPAHFGIEISDYKNVSKYQNNMLERKSVKDSMIAEGIVKSADLY